MLTTVPTDFTMKGMFFTRYVGALLSDEVSEGAGVPVGGGARKQPSKSGASVGGRTKDDAWANVAKELAQPPPNGKYHAFESYPMSDYLRIFDRVARARFPGSTREAYRLLARGEVDVFADSTFGKVTFSMIRDPEVALLRYPEVFGVLLNGPVVVTAERAGPKRVAVTFQRYFGSIELLVGILEGLTMAFDVTPSLDVEIAEDRRTTMTVRW